MCDDNEYPRDFAIAIYLQCCKEDNIISANLFCNPLIMSPVGKNLNCILWNHDRSATANMLSRRCLVAMWEGLTDHELSICGWLYMHIQAGLYVGVAS